MAKLEWYQARLFAFYLAATVAIEWPMLVLIVRRALRRPPVAISPSRLFATAGLMTGCTYPYLWYVVPAVVVDRVTGLWLGETLVVAVETVVVRMVLPVTTRQAFAVSLACNGVSIVLGLALNRGLAQVPGFP